MSVESDDNIIVELADRYSLPNEAVRALLDALRRSGGSMAQFSHPGLGGMGQWSGGMLMIGDMFNDQLKGKVSAVVHELAEHVRSTPRSSSTSGDVSYRSPSVESGDWWPAELGHAASAGAQNQMRYAVFPSSRRLAIKDGDAVSVYDTGEHVISGVSQAQSSSSTISFTSQNGLVRISELRKMSP